MGLGSERHDIHSYETHDSQWLGFRQPVMRAAREREASRRQRYTRQSTPARSGKRTSSGWNLTWRIDPDGSLGHSPVCRIEEESGTSHLGIDEYYEWIF